ncbi:MAG: endonuclease III [Candidatus Lokiarchaeota archaeon]|nr:endonuclease III [Candidatus Lokiarchaeota archaeon]
MSRIKDLIGRGDLERVFVPLLPLFPQAFTYIKGELLERVWPAVKAILEENGIDTNGDRDALIRDLMKEDPVELASEIDSDPFKTLIRTILSARSKDEQTIKVSSALFKHYDTAEKLAAAPPEKVEEIIKPIGFYRAKTRSVQGAARMLMDTFGGEVPGKYRNLLELPGVGPKVANCVLVYAFGIPAIPVDTHVHRIVNRWGLVETTDPEKTCDQLMEILPREWWLVINDLLIRFGKEICKPITPLCGDKCPLDEICPKVIVKNKPRGKTKVAKKGKESK